MNKCRDCTHFTAQRDVTGMVVWYCRLYEQKRCGADGCKEWEAKQYTLDDEERLVEVKECNK